MTAFRAPSWSWASLDAGVMMMMSDSFFEKSIMPRILDVQIQEGDDPMGQNVSASLRIEGHLMTFGIRCGTESTDLGSAEFCINGVWHQPRMESEKLYALRDADEPFRNLHCLVLGGRQTDFMDLICLLIQPTRSKNGEFRRYGRYQFYGQTYDLSVRSDLKNVHNEEWLEYESVGEDGKYIVSIV